MTAQVLRDRVELRAFGPHRRIGCFGDHPAVAHREVSLRILATESIFDVDFMPHQHARSLESAESEVGRGDGTRGRRALRCPHFFEQPYQLVPRFALLHLAACSLGTIRACTAAIVAANRHSAAVIGFLKSRLGNNLLNLRRSFAEVFCL